MSVLRIFKNLSRKDGLFVALSLAFIVAQVWLDLRLPDSMSAITRLLQTPGSRMDDILLSGGEMLLCALGSLLCSVGVAVAAARIAAGFGATLRARLFDKVQGFSLEEINRFSTPSLITRSTNDVSQVQMLIVMGLQAIVKAPIMAAWAITKIAGKSWQWSASTGVAVFALLVVVAISIALVMPKFKVMQRLTDDLNRVTRENLTGLRVVRAYNAEDYQEAKFAKVNGALTDTSLFTGRAMALLMPAIQLVMNGLSLAIYWIGAALIQSAPVRDRIALFSDMVVFSSYAMQVVMSFMMLVMIFIILPRASVSAKRILEVLDTAPTLRDGTVSDPPEDKTGEVAFCNVSFKYPDAEEYVLRDISFTAKRGETVAFIGATGCGKTTLVNLVPRFYDATEGAVLVSGVDVRDYEQRALRSRIGYVAQRAVLFGGTVKQNVAYGDNGRGEPLDTDVVDAVYAAQAADFVEGMENGYDSFVSQGGTNLSGGQKQRLSIARAICRRPEILVFDDSFSALDYRTDLRLREALKKECADATKLIVAQRIGTIRDADQIIVLSDGGMAGKGTHDELMRDCEVYRQIAYSQLSREELA